MLWAIRAQTSSVTTDCLQQAALLATAPLFATAANQGSSRAHLVLSTYGFFNSSTTNGSYNFHKNQQELFSRWMQQYPACFDEKCCFTANTKSCRVVSRWEFAFRMRPNLSISWWQISGLRSERFPHTRIFADINSNLMNSCKDRKNLLVKCSFYFLLRTCTLTACD